jgi:hypothetical protein
VGTGGREVRKKSPRRRAAATMGSDRRRGRKEGALALSISRKRPMSGAGWRARKMRRKGAEERIAWSHGRQVNAARTRAGRSGRRRKISRRSSSVRENMVVAGEAGEVEVMVVAGEAGEVEVMVVAASAALVPVVAAVVVVADGDAAAAGSTLAIARVEWLERMAEIAR